MLQLNTDAYIRELNDLKLQAKQKLISAVQDENWSFFQTYVNYIYSVDRQINDLKIYENLNLKIKDKVMNLAEELNNFLKEGEKNG